MRSTSPGPSESVSSRDVGPEEPRSVAGGYSAIASGYYIAIAGAYGATADLTVAAAVS